MNSIALQRVLVRMLYDSSFAERVIAGEEPLEELDTLERDWLRVCDLRAFRIDPYRRSRSLTALLDEYPGSCAWITRHGGGVAALDAFFGDECFHAGMQAGSSLALLFGDFLARNRHAVARALASLELALARARRERSYASDGSEWRLADGVELVELPRGTAKLRASILEQLRGSSERIIEGELVFGPALGQEAEHFLVRRDGGDELRMEALTPELYRLLLPLGEVGGSEEFRKICAELELSQSEAMEILEDFAASGEVLRPSS